MTGIAFQVFPVLDKSLLKYCFYIICVPVCCICFDQFSKWKLAFFSLFCTQLLTFFWPSPLLLWWVKEFWGKMKALDFHWTRSYDQMIKTQLCALLSSTQEAAKSNFRPWVTYWRDFFQDLSFRFYFQIDDLKIISK